MASEPTPSDLIAERVKALRTGRGMTIKQLAASCAHAGMPRLTEQALYKLEGQRETEGRKPRPVTVDELLVLAYVLDIAPVHLMAGLEDDEAELPVTPAVSQKRNDLRRWIRGFRAVPGMDIRRWQANVPLAESSGRWYWLGQADDVDGRIADFEKALAELRHIKLISEGGN